jgi:hypothetical protein
VFTIDIEDRSISCQPERIVGGLNFDSQEGLLSLAADRGWGKEEMTAIWNGFAGTPEFNDCREQKCFRNRNYAVERIWAAIQRLSQPVTAHGNGHKPLVITASESAAETAPAGAQGASAATEGQEAGETTSQSDEAPLHAAPVGDGKQIEDMIVVPRKRNKKTKEPKVKTPKAPKPARDGSKKAEVIRLLQRKNGASIADISNQFGWKAWSVRGFVSGALKAKMGLKIESFKNSSGERSYRIVA